MKKILLPFSFLLLLLTSCLKETLDDIDSIKGVKADPTWGVPLISAAIGMDKLVTSVKESGQIMESDANKRLVLKFRDEDSTRNRQFLTMPPLDIDAEITMPPAAIPVFVSSGVFQAQIQTDQQINVTNNERVQVIQVNEGSISARFTSEFEHDVRVKITYPSITKNGVPLTDSFDLPYNGTSPVIKNRPLSLNGCKIDLTKNGTTYNTLPYEVEVTITRNPSNGVLSSQRLIVDETIALASYTRADGYFGQIEVFRYDEITTLSMFDKKLEGNVFIREPVLRLRVENEIGMPITGKVVDIYVESGSGVKVPVIVDQLKDTFSLNYSTTPGQKAITEYVIDKDNSNIEDVLSSAPQKMVYSVGFTSNYDNVVKDNVLTDQSNIKVVSTLELPFDLRILYYVMEETGELDLNKTLGDYDTTNINVQWAEFTTESVNELPLNAFMQVYFEDSLTGNKIDSMFVEPYRVAGAEIDAQGNVLKDGNERVTTFMEKARFDRVRSGNRYRITVRLRTSENNTNLPFVTFYEYQKVRAKIGVKANAKVTF